MQYNTDWTESGKIALRACYLERFALLHIFTVRQTATDPVCIALCVSSKGGSRKCTTLRIRPTPPPSPNTRAYAGSSVEVLPLNKTALHVCTMKSLCTQNIQSMEVGGGRRGGWLATRKIHHSGGNTNRAAESRNRSTKTCRRRVSENTVVERRIPRGGRKRLSGRREILRAPGYH